MNEARLIDANELEIELTKQKAHLMDKSYHTTIESDRMMYINTATGLIHAINILHNAPTVEQKEFEQVLQPIKVNIPEDIKDKLIEEMSKPRKVILDEPKTVTDCIIAYGDGFESARRLFESKCHDCDSRKFSETFINGIVEVMTKNGIESVEQLFEILGKGNDND